MPLILNREAWRKLLEGNIVWLKNQSPSLEREHILQIMQCLLEGEKTCPHCKRGKVATFDADNDWCPDCKRWWPVVE
jgi:hypothetical protein